MGKYFGTDGIRGKVNEFLNFDLSFNLGKSLSVLKRNRVVIAGDTRESTKPLKDAVTQGAKINGLDVYDAGVIPTPLLCYLSKRLGAIGVMITASHNPYHDNGIKVFLDGEKLFLDTEETIEKAMDDHNLLPKALRVGESFELKNAMEYYAELYRPIQVSTEMKIALDLANGATYSSAKVLFQNVAKELIVMADSPDGRNINQNCGSTHPELLMKLTESKKADLGFAFDGDGDRVLMVNSSGKLYDGDMMVFAIATLLKKQGILRHNLVVLTKMSNLGIIKAFEKAQIDVVQTDVGDKYVLDELLRRDAVIGGENSGHIINRLLLDTGDGSLNALFLVKLLHDHQTSMEELTKDIVIYPDKMFNLRGVDKTLVKHPEVINKVSEIQKRLGDGGKVLVRASGTEPLIRISVSCPNEQIVDQSIDEIKNTILNLTKNS